MENYNITIVGTGYVGLSNAVLLAKSNNVICLDIDEKRVENINSRKPVFVDDVLTKMLTNDSLSLAATLDGKEAYAKADFVVVAAPTNYDENKKSFDTSILESIIKSIVSHNPKTCIIIKSTVGIGFTNSIKQKYNFKNILFSPEFLREGKSMHDNLYPSRIIVGTDLHNSELTKKAELFSNLLKQNCLKSDVRTLIIGTTEAEAVKMFANSYLAMRVAYFNELDTYSQVTGLDSKNIIEGICLDPRIGAGYNNPSFGYGGYCLPKDTKQLQANFENIPHSMIDAIVESNKLRKEFIASQIIKNLDGKKTIGIYRLIMKSESDNFRSSAIQDIMQILKSYGKNLIIYEPTLSTLEFESFSIVNDFEVFCNLSDIIVANRKTEDLDCVLDKTYTCDIYGDN